MKKVLFLCILPTLLLHLAQAQKAGNLDPSFGTNGIYKTQFQVGNLGEETASKLLVQPDGRIIAIAKLEDAFVLCRYNPDGTIDKTYGTNGHSEPYYFGPYSSYTGLNPFYSVAAVQSDGKIVIGWNVDDIISWTLNSFLIRYNTDGSLDTDFGTVSISEPRDFQSTSIAIQPDGKILVGGYSIVEYPFTDPYFVVARYNSNGTPDDDFGTGGFVTADFYGLYNYASAIALQSDGKIVALGTPYDGGNSAFLTRFKNNGDPDAAWNEDGFVNIDFLAKSLTVQPDQKLVVAGAALTGSSYKLAIRRFLITGDPDMDFSGDGKEITNTGVTGGSSFTLTLQSTGKILVSGTSGGSSPALTLMRFTTTGTLDLSFSGDGKLIPNFYTAPNYTLLPNDKIGITGYVHNGVNKDIMLARYNSNGNPDPTLDGDGKAIIFYQVGYASFLSTARQQDGKLVVLAQSFNGKYYDKILTRYNSNGTLDKTFSEDGMMQVDSALHTVALQPNGKIIVAGGNYFNSTKLPVMARYNGDGSLDRSFANGGKIEHQNSSIVALAIHANGKIIVAGNGGTVSDYDFAVTRYNSNGTLDLTYSNDGYVTTDFGSPHDFVKAVAIQGDGKVVVSGTAFGQVSYDFNTQLALARYNGIGGPDNTFDEDGKSLPEVLWHTALMGGSAAKGSLAIQQDGKIMVAVEQWEELRYQDSPVYHGIARLNTGGSVDESFGELGSIDFNSGAKPKLLIDVQNGNKIILSAGYMLRRYNTDGSPDLSFQDTDKGLSQINDIVIGNNRLYMVGNITTFTQSYAAISAALLKDNLAPVVNIISPANNSTFAAPATFYLIASASDPDGTISKVEFYKGATLLRTERFTPYRCLVENLPASTYKFKAKAYDNLGKTTTTPEITITVTASSLAIVLSSIEAKTGNMEQGDGLPAARLEQNIPNPANSATIIRYYIPTKSGTAQLLLTDLNGRTVQKIQLNSKGSSQISINTSSLPAGTYAYSLYVDGKQADRKMLVIAR